MQERNEKPGEGGQAAGNVLQIKLGGDYILKMIEDCSEGSRRLSLSPPLPPLLPPLRLHLFVLKELY